MNNTPYFVNTITGDPESYQVYQGLTLPELKIKRNGIIYGATDLRALNGVAQGMAINIMRAAASDPEIEEVGFDATGVWKDDLRLYVQIITGMKVESYKRGRSSHYEGCFLVSGFRYEYDDHGELKDVYALLIKDHARYIYDYAHSSERHELNYWDLVVTICDRSQQAIMEACGNEWARKK